MLCSVQRSISALGPLQPSGIEVLGAAFLHMACQAEESAQPFCTGNYGLKGQLQGLCTCHPGHKSTVKVLVAQSCLTLCDPKDCSPPGPSAHGILQARIQEWVAIASSRDLPHPGIEPKSPAAPALQADSLSLSHQGSPSYKWDHCVCLLSHSVRTSRPSML